MKKVCFTGLDRGCGLPECLSAKADKKMKKANTFLRLVTALLLVCLLLCPVRLLASDVSGKLVIDDQAGLLTEEEKAQLINDYSMITEYMEAAFVTTDRSPGSTASYAESYAISHYGNRPAVLFFIDMDDRQLYIYANGSALKTITSADSRAITDNVYKSATRGDFYECADSAFAQILAKCMGQRLARPVKHATNALIAVLAGILLNYYLTVYSRLPRVERRTRGDVNVSVSRQMARMPGISLALPIVLSSVKHYKSSSSGGSGGGGGGHSGGGGGHSF